MEGNLTARHLSSTLALCIATTLQPATAQERPQRPALEIQINDPGPVLKRWLAPANRAALEQSDVPAVLSYLLDAPFDAEALADRLDELGDAFPVSVCAVLDAGGVIAAERHPYDERLRRKGLDYGFRAGHLVAALTFADEASASAFAARMQAREADAPRVAIDVTRAGPTVVHVSRSDAATTTPPPALPAPRSSHVILRSEAFDIRLDTTDDAIEVRGPSTSNAPIDLALNTLAWRSSVPTSALAATASVCRLLGLTPGRPVPETEYGPSDPVARIDLRRDRTSGDLIVRLDGSRVDGLDGLTSALLRRWTARDAWHVVKSPDGQPDRLDRRPISVEALDGTTNGDVADVTHAALGAGFVSIEFGASNATPPPSEPR